MFLNCDTAVSIPFLERLGLEAVSRRFLERLVSSRSWRLNVSVSRVWKIERLGLVLVLRVQRLGLEDIKSRSRGFSLVNIHAMHQACGYITNKIMALTRKKQVVKWQTSPVGVLKTATLRSRYVFWNVSVLWLKVSIPAYPVHMYPLNIGKAQIVSTSVQYYILQYRQWHRFSKWVSK